jgi:ribosomal protein S18 acetylase RimI-like enzyme
MQLDHLMVEPARFVLPYRLRGYEPGDATTWLFLQQSTGIYPPLDPSFFQREFSSSPEGRQFFIMRDQQPVATGTAWHGEPLRTPDWGRLHWVAVHPQHQRRGLGFMLCRHLLAVIREFGCVGAYLTTGSENPAAIALYAKLGFMPRIRTPEEATFWASRRDDGVSVNCIELPVCAVCVCGERAGPGGVRRPHSIPLERSPLAGIPEAHREGAVPRPPASLSNRLRDR